MNSNLHVDETVIRQFCRKWRIRELSLFGSALRDDFNPQSDFDFLVSFEPEATWDLFDLIAMKTEMETLCGRPVDLVEEEALRNPWRKKNILETRRLIYAA